MKHQAITLLKFKSLAARLSLPLWQTIGVLESLWLFAIHHARDGDLSKFKPADIAAWLEYSGDAVAMVDALVETRWLDRQGDALVIHDWADHRPTWLKGVDARQLSSGLSDELSSKLSSHNHTTKCATKQVRLGIGIKRNTSQGKGARKFTAPTLAQVAAYCRERDNSIDPQEFLDHYEANGWRRGKTPIRDWKAAIRTWEHNRRKDQPVSKVVTPDEFAELQRNGFSLSSGANGQ